jgi:hypothetical protein
VLARGGGLTGGTRSNLTIGGTQIPGTSTGGSISIGPVSFDPQDVLDLIKAVRGGSGTKPGGETGSGTSNLQPLEANCPEGTFRLPGLGCVDLMPGGAQTGAGMVVTPGEPVAGAFGLPAFQASVVGEITSKSGQTTIVRRCPKRTVLGLDNKCYVKGTIPRQFRKWPPDARPPVSAFDARMMRKYGKGGTKAKAAKKLATEAGFSCKAK